MYFNFLFLDLNILLYFSKYFTLTNYGYYNSI